MAQQPHDTTHETPFQRAAAAAKQLQEERERLGLPRYREDRPDDAQTLAEREREELLRQGRYTEFLASAKRTLQELDDDDDDDDDDDPAHRQRDRR